MPGGDLQKYINYKLTLQSDINPYKTLKSGLTIDEM